MNAPFKQIEAESAAAVLRNGALAAPLETRRLGLYLVQLGLDVALIFGSYAAAAQVYFGAAWHDRTMIAAQVLILLYLPFALYNATYSMASLVNWKASALRMLGALALSAGLLAFAAFYTKSTANYSRGSFTLGLAFSAVLMVFARVFFTKWINYQFGGSVTNELVIDDGGPPLQIPHAYHVSAAEHGLSPSLGDPHGLDRLGSYLRNMDRVVICCVPERCGEWSLMLKSSGIKGEVISQEVLELGALGVHHYQHAGLASLVVSTGALGLRARVAKRIFDLAVSVTGLVLLSPLMAIIAVAILFESGRPVLFHQRRLGRGNRFFTVYKFRTMAAERSDADGSRSASRGDDRVTPLGRFLRGTSADELPQLVNVLRSEMSIVGPRPHAIGSQAGKKLFWEVDSRYWQRHSLKPGLTGLAQIRGFRGATPAEEDLQLRLRADLEYLNGWSIWRDVRILFLTMGVLVHDRAF